MLWLGLRSNVGTRAMRRRAFLEIVMVPGSYDRGEADDLARTLEPLFGHDVGAQPPVALKQLAAARRFDATPRLGELAGIPTLVVSAAHDPIARPAYGRAVADGIPGATYVEIPDASHGLPIQFPDRVNALLESHLAAADAVHAGRET